MAKRKNFQKISDFNKKIGFNEKLGLDTRDNIILSMVQKNPGVSQEEIARKVRLSQPSVGARLKKLQNKGVLCTVNGVNFRVVDLYFAKVDISSTDTASIIREFKDCSFFINALITSGRYNLCLFFMATDLKRLEGIVNHHLRNNSLVKEVELNIVISTAKDFVLPINIDYENKRQMCCEQHCKDELEF